MNHLTTKFFHFLKNNWAIILITLAGLILRLWDLKFPKTVVFDETYYANEAHRYLLNQPGFDVHPSLGKIVIAISIKIFGFNSFGWRILPALLGSAILPLTYILTQKIFKNKNVALITCLLILLDGLFLVEARTALLMNILLFFTLIATIFAVDFMQKPVPIKLILASIFFGLAAGTMWLVAPILAIVAVFVFKKKKLPIWLAISSVLIIVGIYLASFLFNRYAQGYETYWQYIVWWHKQTMCFHLNLKATHPYASRWWSWLYLGRPVWFYFDFSPAKAKIYGIDAIGNPIIWWTALPIFLYSIYFSIKNKMQTFALPIVVFIGYYFTWCFASRLEFQYYIFPVLPFYFMILAYFLDKLYKQNQYIFWFYFLVVAACFILYLPVLIALPISQNYFNHLLWFKSWV